MTGWHFLRQDRRLQFPPHTLIRPGSTVTAVGRLVLCSNGCHASRRALDALRYAPGPVVCQVRLSGEILDDGDKSVARNRTVLWMADATHILHEFALTCAEQALGIIASRGITLDPRSRQALIVKRRWLVGQASDAELRAASTAAGAAARAAARAAQNNALEMMLSSLLDSAGVSA